MAEPPAQQPEKSAPLEYRGKRTDGPRMSAAGIVALSIAGAICAAFILAVALPTLNPPHVESNRVKCASNLRQIGLACIMYSNTDPQGRFPPSFEVILSTQDISPDAFCCPESNDTPAKGATTQAAVNQLSTGGHLSYIYLGSSLTNKEAADVVLAYEPLKNHGGSGMNVLFADGHVEFLTAAQGQAISAAAQSAAGRKVIWDGKTATLAATQP